MSFITVPQVTLDEMLHCQPDMMEEGSDLEVGCMPPSLPSLAWQPSLALLCSGGCSTDPVWGSLQATLPLHRAAEELTVYSDGSLQRSGSSQSCGDPGFVVLDGVEPLWEVAVHVDGWLSSTKTEVYTCIMALASLPSCKPLKIHTDSQGLIAGFYSFVSRASL